MNNYQDRSHTKHFLHSKIVLVIFGVAVLFFAYSVLKFSVKAIETSRNKANAEVKMAELQAQKDRLTKDIDMLKTEGGVEATIREKYGFAKEGEGLIVVVDEQDKKTQDTQEKGSFWNKFRDWFK